MVAAYILVSQTDWLLKWLPVAIFPAEYVVMIVALVAVWFFINLYLLRRGTLGFITDLVDKWYAKKIDKINHANALSEQGIKQDPLKDFNDTLKGVNEKIISTMRKKDGKNKD